MANELVILETFNTPIEASVVRGMLESEGIRVFLADEATVGIAWHLGTAVGGIKLQVAKEDVERAIALLDTEEPIDIAEEDWQADELEEGDEDIPETSDKGSDDYEPVTPASERVRRAWRSAFIGLGFFPLQIYSLWHIAIVVTGKEQLTPAQRRTIWFALLLNSPVILIYLFLMYIFFFSS
ncbi:MAG: hypothetical protein COA78_32620 [Blastopirellula sp.]|nr:MAG: hypothetical protein COA78_32620 [Blastopirellula sp.]